MQLWEHQSSAVESVRSSAESRIMLCIPTAGGKTHTACAIIASAAASGTRSLFLAHRQELIDQTVRALSAWGVQAGIIMAGRTPDSGALCQVASIQTLARRALPPAGIVFIDEAHRASAASYRRIVEHYSAVGALIIGLSATPVRTDGRPLGGALGFERIIQPTTYSELIRLGHIAEPIVYSTPIEVELSGIKRVAGDYESGALAECVSETRIVGDVFRHWSELADGRRTVIFAVNINHARRLEQEFRSGGARVTVVTGETLGSERAVIGELLRSGELQVVVNVGVYTEGTDFPILKCAIIARPTLSLGLWMQMAGRCLRPWGSVQPVILDHGGNVDRHGLPHEDRVWSLSAKPVFVSEVRNTLCRKCYAYRRTGSKKCPHCGYVPETTESDDIEEASEMRLVKRVGGEDPRIAFFQKAALHCVTNGLRPGYAGVKFKEKFGAWPPWDWTQRLAKAFGADEDWQRRVLERAKNREYWMGRKPTGSLTDA